MIYSLTGKIIDKNMNRVVLDVNGVGYQIFVPITISQGLPSIGKECTIYTYLNVKEDALELYGFSNIKEQDCFKLLISVSGVGPKVGLGILSYMSPDSAMLSISSNDHKAFTKCPGIGPKLAQRIVLELKDKVAKMDISGDDSNPMVSTQSSQSSNSKSAIQALVTLGYSQTEASKVVLLQDSLLPTSEIIRLSLKELAKG